jgi:PAS domain-containing protein
MRVKWANQSGRRPPPIFELRSLEQIAAEALQQSEIRYRRLFESSPVALYDEDLSAVRRFVDDLRSAGVEDFNCPIPGTFDLVKIRT